MNTAKILFKYTSRSRPEWFFRGLNSIIDNLHDKENYHVICSFDSDDICMNNMEVIGKLQEYKNLTYHFGTSKSKVDAINRDCDKFPEGFDILINMSDDMIFTSLFFDRIIRAVFNGNYDQVIHFPDQSVKAALITLSVMGMIYYRRFNYIYFPLYKSLHCDNEFTRVSQILNKYTYIDVQIFKHLHPAWRLAPMDAQYQHTESFYMVDGALYKEREKINFGLDLSK